MAEVNGAAPSPTSQSQSQSATQSQPANPSTPPTQTQIQAQPTTHQQQQPPSQPAALTTAAVADQPSTSLIDAGTSTRPRDARSLHLVLAAKGVAAYQERVPLQLLDFAYRYTSGILSDAQHLNAEGYIGVDGTTGPGHGGGGGGGRGRGARHNLADEVTLSSVRMAAASRLGYQFSGPLPKEQMLELANERNRIKLPAVDKESARFGVRLPPERFVLSEQGWQVPSEWDDELGSEEEGADGEDGAAGGDNHTGNGVQKDEGDEDMADEGEERYEDVFGEEGGDEDKMED